MALQKTDGAIMMNMATLNRYLAGRYFRNFVFLTSSLLCVVYLFDMVELIRRANKFDNIPFSLVLQMSLLKLPEVGQILMPFAILFSAMFTFWQMTQKLELIVMRAAGFSVWQFLAPIMAVAVFIGIAQMSIINPVGAIFLGKFKDLENKYLSRNKSEIALFKEGLWLRQDLQQKDNGAYAIFHAAKISQPSWVLSDVTVLQFSADSKFQNRIDASKAILEKGKWILSDTILHNSNSKPQHEAIYTLPTNLTIQEIEESFASPETMSFWHLPGYIQTLEATGFDATRLKVHYQSLWAQPLLFASLILIAATVSMRPPRFQGTFTLIVIGIFTGFIIFFASNFLQALGSSHQIPVFLASWAPTLICILLGASIIMSQEDG